MRALFLFFLLLTGCAHLQPKQQLQTEDKQDVLCILVVFDECNVGFIGNFVCFQKHKIVKIIPVFRDKPETCAKKPEEHLYF